MINGATQIIAGVPGKHLDPLLLAQSQTTDSVGFIMIAYQRQSTGEGQQVSRFYDLLFFRGPEIFECARLNQDLRFQLHQEAAFQTFKSFGRDHGTRVFLFLASEELLHRFQSTFYYEPCLKVQVRALSKKQIITLLKSTGCQRGIIECNEFTQLSPSMELQEISSPDDIIQYQPKFKHGRILLYDTEKNKELVQERYSVQSNRLPRLHGGSADNETKGEKLIRPSFHILGSSKDREIDKREPTLDEKEAEEFTEFIKKILNTPTSSDSKEQKDQGFVIARKESKTTSAEENADSADERSAPRKKQKSPRLTRSAERFKAKEPPSHPKTNLSEPKPDEPPGEEESNPQSITNERTDSASAVVVAEDVQVAAHPDYIKLFERLFRSFRQQVFDCYGDKSESVITEAERKVRFLTPEFDLRALNEETAIVTLDLVETIANEANFFKRSKLREAALTLVADLYNKQYLLLEQHRAIEKVEQFYYRLKR
jgi:hypothetical protein